MVCYGLVGNATGKVKVRRLAKVKVKKGKKRKASGDKAKEGGSVLDKFKKQRAKSPAGMGNDINWLRQQNLPAGETTWYPLVEDFHPHFIHWIPVGDDDRSVVCSGDYDTVMEQGADPENCRVCRVMQYHEFSKWAPKSQFGWWGWFDDIEELIDNANPDLPTLFITGGMIYEEVYDGFIAARVLEEEGGKERKRKLPPIDQMQLIISKTGKKLKTKYKVDEGDLEKRGGKLVCTVEVPDAVRENCDSDTLDFEKYLSPKDKEYLDDVLGEYESQIPSDFSPAGSIGNSQESDDEFDPIAFIDSDGDVADLSKEEVRALADELGIKAKKAGLRRKKVAIRIEENRDQEGD